MDKGKPTHFDVAVRHQEAAFGFVLPFGGRCVFFGTVPAWLNHLAGEGKCQPQDYWVNGIHSSGLVR